jgi:hypothetical protein
MMSTEAGPYSLFFAHRLARYGATAMVVITTVIIVLFSLAITSISLVIFQGYIDRLGLAICVAAPLLIFPLPARLFFTTFLRLQTAEEELRKRNLALELALQEVKTLSGLLPICCACKKIRDDQGYWNDVENYISDHSDLQLTHGFCPDCVARLYPELPPLHQSQD